MYILKVTFQLFPCFFFLCFACDNDKTKLTRRHVYDREGGKGNDILNPLYSNLFDSLCPTYVNLESDSSHREETETYRQRESGEIESGRMNRKRKIIYSFLIDFTFITYTSLLIQLNEIKRKLRQTFFWFLKPPKFCKCCGYIIHYYETDFDVWPRRCNCYAHHNILLLFFKDSSSRQSLKGIGEQT